MQLRELLARLLDRTRRDRLAAELDEELRHHRDLLERDAQGSARRRLGNATYYKEEAHAMWSLGLVDDLLQDIRYAARVLRRDAGFTGAVVITLALGIGLNTAVFSIVNAVLLRPLAYADPEQLVSVSTISTGAPSELNPASLPDIRDWQNQATVFSGLAGYGFNRFDLNGPEGVTQARGVQGTGELYGVLGARPLIGRLPRPDEERQPVLAISYRLWQTRFAGAATAVGSRLELNGQPYTIIGVMPRGFEFPGPDIDLWTTLYSIVSQPAAAVPNPWITSRSLHGYRVVARLAPGVTMPQAERAMNQIEDRLAKEYPDADGGTDIRLRSVRDQALGGVQRVMWTVFGAAGLILLLACVNVAHLLLTRLSGRGREFALRRALGAGRERVARQLVTETVVLALLAGVAGIAVAFGAMRILIRVNPGDIPRLDAASIDGATLGFALIVSVATGIVFGVMPMLVGWGEGRGLHDTLRTQGTGATRGAHGRSVRSVLTSLEAAFAVILLVGAGLMLRSFAEMTSADLGVRPAGVVISQLVMLGPAYENQGARARALQSVVDKLHSEPGVTAAGASTSLPPTRIQEIEPFTVTGKAKPEAGHEPSALFIPMTSGFLEAIGVPLIRGRSFDTRDGESSPPVIVISHDLARRYFAGVDAVGRQLDVSGVTRTIVGVAGDAVYEGLGAPIRPTIYLPFAQSPFPGVYVAVRSQGASETSVAAEIRDAVRGVDPGLTVHRPRQFESLIADSVVRPRFQAWLLGAFGGLALLLASIGIYSVIAYGVSQRRAEIGIRLALGAPQRAVIAMMLRAGAVPVAVGILGGLAVALGAAKVMRGLLYGVPTTDAITFVAVAIVFGATGLFASYVPARRAARVDPLSAIRAE